MAGPMAGGEACAQLRCGLRGASARKDGARMEAVLAGGRRTWRLRRDLRAEKGDGAWLLAGSRASTC